MKRSVFLLIPVFVATSLMIASASSVTQAPSDPGMVFLRVSAVDRNGRFIVGLAQGEFKIFEDNVPQKIAYFSDNDAPLSGALLFDADARTSDQVKETAFHELRQSPRLTEHFYQVNSNGAPLNDAIYDSLKQLLQRPEERRALILFTASDDPGARSLSKVKELLKDQDVRLYVIAVPPQNSVVNEQSRSLLRDLAEISGGTAFFPSSMIFLPDVYRKIGADLRNQYVIGYHPSNRTQDGKWRKIKVNAQHVDAKGKALPFDVRTKAGYYARNVSPGK